MTANVYGATDKVAKAGDTMTGTLVLTGATPMQIPVGAATGDVLTSDGSGNASWQVPGALNGVDYLNVKAYGATGNGSTDDTTAIQNAINAAGVGQVVYFPRGTYIVSALLTLVSSVLYLGSDVDKTTIKMKAGANLGAVAASTGWVGSTATSSVDPLHIRNLTFDGNRANQTGGTGHGVVLQTYYATVENCTFQNTLGDGLRFDATGANGSTTISNTMVENRVSRVQCRSNGGNGINVNDPSHNKATDGWLQHVIVDTPGQNGILCQSSAGWTVDGCHVYNIPFSGIRMDRAFETRIVNNYVESCGTSSTSGFYFLIDCANGQANDGGQGSVIANNTIYFQGPPGNAGSTIAGISVQSASGGSANFAIIGNQLFCTGSSGLAAIQLQNQSSTASLTAKVSGNNMVGWTTSVSQIVNGGTMTTSGDNISPVTGTFAITGTVASQPSSSSGVSLSTNVNGADAFDRYRLTGDGTVNVGSGTAARDTTYGRAGAGVFYTPKTFLVGASAPLGDNGVGELQLADAATAPTTNPTSGSVIYSQSGSGTPVRLRDTAGNVRGLVPNSVIASVNQSITSQISQTASTSLTVAVEASATYLVDACVFFNGPASNTIVVAFTAPTGATMVWGTGGSGQTAATSPTATATWNTNGTGTTNWIRIGGSLITSTTAGQLTFTFAQGTSSTTATTIQSGSVLRLERIK